MLFLITLATFCSTMLGGLFALRLRDRLHLILGFSAGAVIAVAFFDLLPEALDLTAGTYSASNVLVATAVGFMSYLVIDRFVLLHAHGDEHDEHDAHDDSRRGVAGAGSLSIHSFLDGVGIGLAFQVSPAVGAVVAAAVLTHDFSDGINTVNMVIKNGGERSSALRWLLVDAAAPVVGVLSTFLFVLPSEQLGLLLALFAGFFLYIGATDLIPESYHAHPVKWTTFMTVAGVAVLLIIIRLAGV